MAVEWKYSTPVQCSEDVQREPPSFQTDRKVSVPDIVPDAARADQPSPAGRPDRQGNLPGTSPTGNVQPTVTRDKIILTPDHSEGRIEAEGLASVLQPGGIFRMGVENHTQVFHTSQNATGKRRPSNIKNKHKLTESSAEPVIKHLDVISAGLADDYLRLGRHLGLADSMLSQIHLDYRADGLHEVSYRVLARWKQQFAPVTVRMLAKTLLDIGRGDLADELRHG